MAGKDTSFASSDAASASAVGAFWQKAMEEIKNLNQNDFKAQELPLARIKKIMKLDDDVKMISAEAPVLFAKAAEIFISELSLRAWIHTEENKRRTLQRNDIAMAISKFDQFDFLIDIVPRDELKPTKRAEEVQRASMVPDQVSYFLQLAQQTQAALNQQQTTPAPAAAQPAAQPAAQAQTIQIQGQAGQIIQQATAGQQVQLQVPQEGGQGQPQIIQLQVQQPQQQQQQTPPQPTQPQPTQQQTTQVYHQIFTPSGEVQNIPIQLTADQLQALQLQIQGKQPGQPIIIQTAGAQNTEQISQASQPMFQVQQVGGQQVFIQQSDDAQQSDTQES